MSAHRNCIKWLQAELPELIAQGVLSDEGADRLRHYYGETGSKSRSSLALIVCGVLGAILIGLGIVLLFAHNWYSLSRGVRMACALGLVLGGQGLAGWVIRLRENSLAWLEGAAVFLMLMLAGAMGIINQTYQIATDTGAFALTWMLLSLPLIYLLRATLPAVIYLAGITVWAFAGWENTANVWYFWLLAAMALPHFFLLRRENPAANRLTFFAWAFAIWLAGWFVPLALPRASSPHGWILIYTGLFAAMYLAGVLPADGGFKPRHWPFLALGAGGVFVISYTLTYQDIWQEACTWLVSRLSAQSTALIVGLPLIAGGLLVLHLLRCKRPTIHALIGAAPLLAFCGHQLARYGEAWPRLLFNAYSLAIGICLTIAGLRSNRLAVLNLGLVLTAALIITRFFDGSFGLVLRGAAFILIGLGFLLANLFMLRKRKGAA